MSTNNSQLPYLVRQYLDDTCTPEELAEFWRLIGDLKEESPMQEALQHLWQQSKAGNDTPAIGWDQVLQKIYDKASPAQEEQTPIIPLRKRPVIRWAAAAALVLSLGAGGYWFFSRTSGSTKVVTTKTVQDIQAPQTNRATITLANGKTIYLDSAANGSLATQHNVQLVKLADGQIAYKGAAHELVYNTLTNPRGSKVIDMTLSDGSRIWLNAGSSITYPVTFVGNERNVAINGEVYFEVAPLTPKGGQKKVPFVVNILPTGRSGGRVEVLGTHFNINAYDDEPDVKVTLLEGAVNVGNNMGLVNIKPGEQATISTNLLPHTSGNINLEQVMAWKNGLFSFTGADLTTVMRQLARWYDIQVKYEGQIPARKFSGEITHDLTLSQLMNGLQSLGIQFRIEGRTMIVQQK
jgi:ferric-dicitrate binding protein FerR (iron transport regulator)